MRRPACPTDEVLSAFQLGDLAEAELDAVAEHLERCPRCEERAQRLDGRTDRVIAALRRSPPPAPGATEAATPPPLPPRRRERPDWANAQTRMAGGPRAGGGADPEAPPGELPKDTPALADYEVREVLGRGGMGVVYKARHRKLNRLVALKMTLASPGRSPSRIRVEAEAVARLQHPNIVQIYETGEHEGHPYLALELVEGKSLEQKIAGRPQPARAAAEMIRDLALAMEFAHRRGIVHRDLKPSNILLTPEGVPKITDFGIAKRLEEVDNQTKDGEVIGTPSYMAPEQAGGDADRVGPRTDVYSLGVLLYEMLTGRAPLQAPTPIETLMLVCKQDPVPPRQLQPRLPRDLETITLKCLQKEPSRRYAGAQALADDLDRFLRGEPIQARPISPLERAVKWTRRRPAAALLFVVAVLMFAGGGLAAWQYSVMLHWYNAELRVSAELADAHARRADSSKDEALIHARAEADERRQAETALYFSRIALAEGEWRSNNVAGTRILLEKCLPTAGRGDLIGWEWRYLDRLCHADLRTLAPHRSWVHDVAYSPDGARIVAASGVPHNLPGRDPLRTPGDLKVWDAATGALLHRFEGIPTASWSVAISPDGGRIASSSPDGSVLLWDAQTFRCLAVLAGSPTRSSRVRFSPDGAALAVADDRGLRVLDASTHKERFALHGFTGTCSPAFSPDGRRIAAGGETGLVTLVDAAEGKPIRTLAGRHGDVRAVAFHPSGTLLATANERGPLTLWDAETGRAIRDLQGHSGESTSVAFSPDGTRLASTGADQTVRLWDPRAGAEVRIYRGHTFGVRAVAFDPDGGRLASAGQDGTVKVWDLSRDQRGLALAKDGRGEWVGNLTFADEGRRVVAARHEPPRIQAWDAASGAFLGEHAIGLTREFRSPRGDTAFGDGGRILVGPEDADPRVVKAWDVATGKETLTLRGHSRPVRSVAVSPDGTRIASASGGPESPEEPGELLLWDAETGSALARVELPAGASALRLAFSPDGSTLAAGCHDGSARLWDAETGREGLILPAHLGSVTDVAFSPDGRRLATVAREDPTVRVWDLSNARELLTLRGHTHALTGVAFSPDGLRLASVGFEGAVKLWDAATGQDILTLRGFAPQRPGDYYFNARVAFSPDGSRIASNTWDGILDVWDAGPPRPSAGSPR